MGGDYAIQVWPGMESSMEINVLWMIGTSSKVENTEHCPENYWHYPYCRHRNQGSSGKAVVL